MREITMDEIKKLQLDILVQIAAFCKAEKLTWWLDYGTLIGAARHKGYIPWDDDVDIGMPREDYDFFIKNFNQSGNQRYIVSSMDSDHHFPWPFAKVFDMNTTLFEPDINGLKQHVFVDLFVYDNAPDNDRVFRKMQKETLFLSSLHSNRVGNYIPRGNSIRRAFVLFARSLLRLFPEGFFCSKVESLRQRYNGHNTKRIACYYSKGEPVLREDMIQTRLADFEQYRFPIPMRFEEHILGCYGFPYDELPPEEQRVNKHQFVAYLND